MFSLNAGRCRPQNGQVYVAGLRLWAGLTDHQRTACAWLTERRLRARRYVCLKGPEAIAYPPLPGGEVLLELGDLVAAAPDQPQLPVDVRLRLLQDLPLPDGVLHPASPLPAKRRASLLRGHELAKLVERKPEEILQPQHLLEGLHVSLPVRAMGAPRPPLRPRQEADLLVVADRPWRRARKPGHLPDAKGVGDASGAHAGSCAVAAAASRGRAATASAGVWRGRRSETPAPTKDVAASTQRAVCMLWMKGSSLALESPLASPEKIWNRTSLGTAAVTIAITKAIEITAPVFCSIVLAPAAMPRRFCGTVPIIAAVFGELNIPEPIPTSPSQSVLCQ